MRFFFSILLVLLCLTNAQSEDTKYLALPFKNLEGKAITLSQLKGKPVLIEFWASWCFACKMSFVTTNRLNETFRKKAYIIGINTDIGDPQELKEVIDDNEIKFTVWLNHPEGNLEFGGISALPTFIILDEKGRIVKKIVGLKKDTEKEIEMLLNKLIK